MKWAQGDIGGWIPYGWILPVLEPGTRLKDDRGQEVLKVRWNGMAVYVKQKNTRAAVEVADVTNQMQEFLQGKHEKHGEGDINERIVRATLLPAGPLSPSAAAVFVRPRQPGDGTMMFIAWQGTQAADRPMDIFTDLSAAPARCTAWNQTHDTLWAHSAMLAKVQSDFLEHRKKVEGVMKEYKVSHVVFTGHSLGAGCALIAHMLALTDASASSLVEDVYFESIVFASPMVWYSPNGGAGNIGDDIKNIFSETSVNYVFDQDVVPRLPGLPDFYRPAVKKLAESLLSHEFAKMLCVGDYTTSKQRIDQAAEVGSGMFSTFLSEVGAQDTFKALENYFHLSKIVYAASKPGGRAAPVEPNNFKDCCGSFVDVKDQDYKYFLACHSFFPDNVTAELLWEFKAKGGTKWIRFDPETSKALSRASRMGKSTETYKVGEAEYEANLNIMHQTNSMTNHTREIRCSFVFGSISTAAAASSTPIGGHPP
eukprot:CAMPEP_0183530534 /NCGR_PEP_ID=MMETSP0371-20130417/24176_1 /TAXON_ID=268820 /ORGANISM="Peridinium aciculiferum, Strain PAER-2" /LENGTH=481 /DNA_ID=CAMNT_0025730435 /DNA_START=39 /DNA_END=1484 /DNA_ORIENTATION=+